MTRPCSSLSLDIIEYADSGELLHDIKIHTGDDVHSKLAGFCKGIPMEECRLTEDRISEQLYGLAYTSTTANRSRREFQSNRMDAVAHITRTFGYTESYLEIGCYKNDLFDAVQQLNTFQIMVGVDPAQGGTHRMTSDAFFAANTDQYFDLIFIDGLHEADQVFRDIQNALRWLSPNGTILLHDSNPRNRNQQFKAPVEDHMWLGDTWKAVVSMRLHPHVEVVVLDVDYGVAVMRRRENKHPLPNEWVQFLGINPIAMLDYNHLRSSGPVLHRHMTFDMLREWLREEEQ